ncbi:hypothetical protein [Staphylococcus epidermidis]
MDGLLLNRYVGIGIFLGIMWVIFERSFRWIGRGLCDELDGFISGGL